MTAMFFSIGFSLLLCLDRLHQAAGRNDLLDKGRKRLGLEGLACGMVGDDAGVKVHAHGVACADGVHSLRALHDG